VAYGSAFICLGCWLSVYAIQGLHPELWDQRTRPKYARLVCIALTQSVYPGKPGLWVFLHRSSFHCHCRLG